jgi:hypothetical protein
VPYLHTTGGEEAAASARAKLLGRRGPRRPAAPLPLPRPIPRPNPAAHQASEGGLEGAAEGGEDGRETAADEVREQGWFVMMMARNEFKVPLSRLGKEGALSASPAGSCGYSKHRPQAAATTHPR